MKRALLALIVVVPVLLGSGYYGGGGASIGGSVTGATAGRVLFTGTGPVLADDGGLTYSSGSDTLTVGAQVLATGTQAAPAYAFGGGATQAASGAWLSGGAVRFGYNNAEIFQISTGNMTIATQVTNAGGTQAAPAYSFTGGATQSASGMWLAGSALRLGYNNTLGVVLDASTLNSQLPVQLPNGSSSAVSLKFADNSGWYRTSANQWGWTSEQGSAPTPPALEVLNAGIKVRDEATSSTLANTLSSTTSTATYTLPSGGISHDFVGNSNSGAFISIKNATTSRTWYMGSLGSNYVDGVKAFSIRGGDTDTFRMMIKPNGDVGFGPDFDSGFNTFTVKQGADVTGLTGTTTVNGSTTVTGSGTLFQQEVGIGDRISVSSASSTYATVTAIASNTSLTVSANLGDGTSQTINRKRAMLSVRDSSNATKLIVDDSGDTNVKAALVTDCTTVALTADNQAVASTNLSCIAFTSDDATGTNRTIVLGQSTKAGQILRLMAPGSNACELVDDAALGGAGNVRLASTWTCTQYDTLTLISDGTDWREVSRSAN